MPYQVGDVLVQKGGQPWVFLANIFTGHPYPHARMISLVTPERVYTIEDMMYGVKEYQFNDLKNFEVWRPRCSDKIKGNAIRWARTHRDEGYGYLRLLEICLGYRLGMRSRPGMDDDVSQDNRRKVCSELVAMAYYRSGFDLVPGVENRDTMPYELRSPVTCEMISVDELLKA